MTTFVIEDPSKFAPGDVVVADGSKRRMMITKVVVGFAETVWFEDVLIKKNISLPAPRFDIFHMSDLTLDKDQQWLTK